MSRKITLNNFLIFEPEKKRITGKGRPVTISAPASLCLELLIDNVGQLVTHQQFFDYAWRRFGMEPTSTSLYQNISGLRRAINKAGLQEDIIRTMPRRGFLLSPQTTVLKERLSDAPSVIASPADTVTATADDISVNEAPAEMLKSTRQEEIQQEKIIAANKHSYLQDVCSKIHSLYTGLRFNKLIVLTLLLGFSFFLYYFFHFLSRQDAEDAVFVYSTDYKGCTIFNNNEGWLSADEVKNQVDQLNISCRDTTYIYLTAYKYADSLSYFDCQHPLTTGVRANCRSHYFVKSLNDE